MSTFFYITYMHTPATVFTPCTTYIQYYKNSLATFHCQNVSISYSSTESCEHFIVFSFSFKCLFVFPILHQQLSAKFCLFGSGFQLSQKGVSHLAEMGYHLSSKHLIMALYSSAISHAHISVAFQLSLYI